MTDVQEPTSASPALHPVRAVVFLSMDPSVLLNIALVLVFVLIGGVFAGTEMAIVNLRESQIKQLEESGPRGERTATLVRDPNQFLSAVQIGVTVAGFFSSAYGASTIAPSPGAGAGGSRAAGGDRGDGGADRDDPGHRVPLPRWASSPPSAWPCRMRWG